ncbi:hypothetical protein ML462_09055 [Gramella lutea]|uniref:DUF1735 domain-containing protein n=1 Tax=Christiangramia lutea TaxID=1607951 RepID=A0A9X1V372_9FLAO|nr:hypothetical protein [Christiangramia lutea]MCH4823323.1 hypothetical protein [Christiangramia lutea]
MKNKLKRTLQISTILSFAFLAIACNDNDEQPEPSQTEANLIIKLDVDPNQLRLGNTGNPSQVPEGNAAQDPNFNSISAHYLEFAPDAFTPLGEGEILYHAPETTAGGDNAIDFDESITIEPGEIFLSIPLKNINPGNYEWVRLSLSYQNLDAKVHYEGNPYEVTIAGFVGFNTYISSFRVKNENVEVNDDKLQGFFAFESLAGVSTGQVPPGGITVPNPIFETSPIPQGSCVVTGEFSNPLIISGNENEDITVVMSLSTNKSFEWEDLNSNGKWDIGGENSEPVVDMGLRGLIPKVE